MSYWVGVDDNLNKGWPKVINAASKPAQYVRVYGPYTTLDEATTQSQNIPTVTTGYHAVCSYGSTSTSGSVVSLTYPPNSQQYATFYGPYDTSALAQAKASTLSCSYTTTPATDICAPSSLYSIPPTLECSLVCSAIGWPMQSGTMQLTFYRRTCLPGDPESSMHFPGIYNINLGCAPGTEDTPATGWVGRSAATNILLLTGPDRGYTVRFSGTMAVLTADTVAINATIERLFAGVDVNPTDPPDNRWGSCGTFSGVATRVVPPGVDPNDRTITRTYETDLIAFVPSCTTDIHYGKVVVTLLPWAFGCDGTANGGQTGRCPLVSHTTAYSCLTAYVRPLLNDRNYPQTTQLGINSTGGTNNGCFEGNYSVGPSYTINPAYAEESPLNILNAGCPGEAINLNQQLQMGNCGGFQILIKSIDKGPLHIGVRRGIGYAWTWQAFSSTTLMSAVPFSHKFTFNGLLIESGVTTNIEVYIYGLAFPPVEIQDCMQDDGTSGGGSGSAVSSPEETTPSPVAAMVASYNERYPRNCIHLGVILKKSCCGAPSLHECRKGLGNTRPVGAPWNDEEISCRGCQSFESRVQ